MKAKRLGSQMNLMSDGGVVGEFETSVCHHVTQAAVLGGELGGYVRRRQDGVGSGVPVGRKACFDKLVGEVFKFAR